MLDTAKIDTSQISVLGAVDCDGHVLEPLDALQDYLEDAD